MKTYDLSNRWRRVVRFTPLPLYPGGKCSRLPVYRGLGELHSRSEHYVEEKNLLPLLGIEPHSSITQPVA
jgi:hypothetical protein